MMPLQDICTYLVTGSPHSVPPVDAIESGEWRSLDEHRKLGRMRHGYSVWTVGELENMVIY
jgi:hypothetical protein